MPTDYTEKSDLNTNEMIERITTVMDYNEFRLLYRSESRISMDIVLKLALDELKMIRAVEKYK